MNVRYKYRKGEIGCTYVPLLMYAPLIGLVMTQFVNMDPSLR